MSAPAIFVSHSHKDDVYCHALVAGLRAAGLDVWYDEHNASSGHLRTLIERELRLRPIFVVVLSPAALASQWVSDECDWAFNLYRRDQAHRVMLPVLAETVNEDDIWLFLQQFKRVEQAGLIPWPAAEAARRVALAVDPNAPLASPQPQPMPTADSHLDEAEALVAAGNTLVSIGQRDAAIEVYRRATQTDPRCLSAWNMLGYYLEYFGRHAEGLQAFEKALSLDARNAFAWAGKAETLAWLDRAQEALTSAEMALRFDPTSAYAHNAKGAALDALQHCDEALAFYDRALALDATSAPAWTNKGAALNSLDRFWEALDACERALILDPNFDVAWGHKCTALCGLGHYQKALDAFDHAISIKPSAIRWKNKAATLRKLRRTAEADAAERKAKELEAKQ